MKTSLIVRLLIGAAPALPAMVQDFTKLLKDAQTSEDAQAKLKALVNDVLGILSEVAKVL